MRCVLLAICIGGSSRLDQVSFQRLSTAAPVISSVNRLADGKLSFTISTSTGATLGIEALLRSQKLATCSSTGGDKRYGDVYQRPGYELPAALLLHCHNKPLIFPVPISLSTQEPSCDPLLERWPPQCCAIRLCLAKGLEYQ
jgi:hypothetical protein